MPVDDFTWRFQRALARIYPTIEEILGYRIEHGLHPIEGADAYVQQRLDMVTAKKEKVDVVELRDGRVIAVFHHPMSDGGWVSTGITVYQGEPVLAVAAPDCDLYRILGRVKAGVLQLGRLVAERHHEVRETGRHALDREVRDQVVGPEPRRGGHGDAVAHGLVEPGRQL